MGSKTEHVEHKRTAHPDPVDVYVGARLRIRRNLAGLSQEQLGKASGLTFQQIQKYERGINRIGASRLFRLSRFLGVPVSYFFEGMDAAADLDEEKGLLRKAPGMADTGQQKLENVPWENADILRRRETLDLIRAYYCINDPRQRRKIYELVKSMAEEGR